MAYITSEEVSRIRKELKASFPNFKFSVTKHNHSSVTVAIMEAPIRFTETNYDQLNHYHLYQYEHSEILEQIKKIITRNHYDNSDIQTDYFDVSFYYSIHVGKWDRDFKQTGV